MDLKSETDDFRYFDPKLLRGTSPEFGPSRTQTQFNDAIVFVVGGGKSENGILIQGYLKTAKLCVMIGDFAEMLSLPGNYIEYQNLVECMRTKSSPRNVIYGCTELTNAKQFLQQLASLGEEIN